LILDSKRTRIGSFTPVLTFKKVGNSWNVTDDYPGLLTKKEINEDLQKAQNAFKRVFGKEAKSIIPPNYAFDIEERSLLTKNGFSILQGYSALWSYQSDIFSKFKQKFTKIGEDVSDDGKPLYALKRNCHFEYFSGDSSSVTLKQIEKLIKNNKPIILSTHRVNFVRVNSVEVDIALKDFDKLLAGVTTLSKKYRKDLIFADDVGLIEMMQSSE